MPEGCYLFTEADLDSLVTGRERVDFSRDAVEQDAFFAKIAYKVAASYTASGQMVFGTQKAMYKYLILAIDQKDKRWKIIGRYPAKARFASASYYLENYTLYGFDESFRQELTEKLRKVK